MDLWRNNFENILFLRASNTNYAFKLYAFLCVEIYNNYSLMNQNVHLLTEKAIGVGIEFNSKSRWASHKVHSLQLFYLRIYQRWCLSERWFWLNYVYSGFRWLKDQSFELISETRLRYYSSWLCWSKASWIKRNNNTSDNIVLFLLVQPFKSKF